MRPAPLGGDTPQIIHAQGTVAGEPDGKWRKRLERRQFGGDAAQRLPQRKLNGCQRLEAAKQSRERHVKRSERAAHLLREFRERRPDFLRNRCRRDLGCGAQKTHLQEPQIDVRLWSRGVWRDT